MFPSFQFLLRTLLEPLRRFQFCFLLDFSLPERGEIDGFSQQLLSMMAVLSGAVEIDLTLVVPYFHIALHMEWQLIGERKYHLDQA